MPFNLGFSELLVILLIVLLVFGAKRLPEMGAAMGKGIREFKRSVTEVRDSIEDGGEASQSSRQLDSPSRLDSPATKGGGGEPKKLSQ